MMRRTSSGTCRGAAPHEFIRSCAWWRLGRVVLDSVLAELKVRGHRAAAVDLSPDDMGAGAVRCAEIVNRAFANLSDLVLVGHSIAGLIIPLVAARRRLRRLVFVHALLPRPGQSVVDQMKAEPDMFNAEMFTATAPFWEDEAVA